MDHMHFKLTYTQKHPLKQYLIISKTGKISSNSKTSKMKFQSFFTASFYIFWIFSKMNESFRKRVFSCCCCGGGGCCCCGGGDGCCCVYWCWYRCCYLTWCSVYFVSVGVIVNTGETTVYSLRNGSGFRHRGREEILNEIVVAVQKTTHQVLTQVIPVSLQKSLRLIGHLATTTEKDVYEIISVRARYNV